MTFPRAGFEVVFGDALARRSAVRKDRDPGRVRQRGNSHEVYGVSASLLTWRDKRTENRCRMCLRPADVRQLTLHHVVPGSYFRRRPKLRLIRNVAANLVPLCREDHDAVEHDPEARRLLRKTLAPDEITFALQVAGEDWFDARYPTSARR